MENILSFLRKLKTNNNRAWFEEHKEEYNEAKNDFEKIGNALILKISTFDDDIGKVNIKDCIFRIYRDLRFTPDKTPYKTHFGASIAYPNGRKSPRARYYLHIAPDDNSFFSVGVWSPKSPILNALRRSIFENYNEFKEIIDEPDFDAVFGNSFYEKGKLKRIPIGFPANFENPDILKLKHYLVTVKLTDKEILSSNFLDFVTQLAKIAYPFVQFLNYTIDEEKQLLAY